MHDLRSAVRSLARRPGATVASVVALALGLGAAAMVAAVIDAALVRPLPFPDPERLVDLRATSVRHPGVRLGFTPADFLAWRDGTAAFEHLGAYVPFGTLDLTGEGEPVRLSRHLVSTGLLEALSVQPLHGRLFTSEELGPGGPRAVLLSHRLWRGRFGADPGVVGRSVTLGGEPYSVAGVLPERFRIAGGEPDLLAPLAFGAAAAHDRSMAPLGAIGRLRAGVPIERARAELTAIAARFQREHPETNAGVGPSLLPLAEALAGGARPALLALAGAVALLLLVACVNAAGLGLVRAAARAREIAVRAALGAGAGRLARQLLAEGALLGLAAGGLGLALAALGLAALPDARGVYLPRHLELGIDRRLLVILVPLSLAAGLAAGLPAALRAARTDIAAALELRSVARRRRGLLGDVLVVPQVAIACALLAGAGLVARSFADLLAAEPGWEPSGRLVFDLEPADTRWAEPEQVAAFYRRLVGELAGLPGITAVGATTELPTLASWSFRLEVEGRPPEPDDAAGWRVVTAGYFAAVGTPVLRGRAFTDADRAGARLVMAASESAAERFFSGDDALGRRVRFNGRWFAIVGVVADQLAPGDVAPRPTFYAAHAQAPVPPDLLRPTSVVVRTSGDPLALAGAVRQAVHALDPDLPVGSLETMEERRARSLGLARPRVATAFLACFSGLAAGLAALGLHALLAHLVGERTHELGVRLALGARGSDLERMVLARGLGLAAAGLALGTLAALALSRALAGIAPGAERADAATLAATAFALLLVAGLACWLPARRAGRTDPLALLRSER